MGFKESLGKDGYEAARKMTEAKLNPMKETFIELAKEQYENMEGRGETDHS